MAFLPNPNNLPQVNHKDGNKLNNDPANLEWCDAKQNLKHAADIGLRVPARGEASGVSKLTEDSVRDIRASFARGDNRQSIAERHAITRGNVYKIANKVSWAHLP